MKEKSEAGISELNRITGGVINGGDNETQGLTVEEMLYESVLYAVGTRCGFDMSAEEQDMSFIINISDEDDIYRFGSLVCDVSCSCLLYTSIVGKSIFQQLLLHNLIYLENYKFP